MPNNYKPLVVEAGAFALFGFLLNLAERFVMYAMEPDVLVEEKEQFRQNQEILRANFTK